MLDEKQEGLDGDRATKSSASIGLDQESIKQMKELRDMTLGMQSLKKRKCLGLFSDK